MRAGIGTDLYPCRAERLAHLAAQPRRLSTVEGIELEICTPLPFLSSAPNP